MNNDVDAGATDPVLLPVGYFGPPKYSNVNDITGSGTTTANTFITGGAEIPTGLAPVTGQRGMLGSGSAVQANLVFPSVRLRLSASEGGLSDPTDAYFGMSSTRISSSTRPDDSIADPHRLLYASFPDDPTAAGVSLANGTDAFAYVFSLNDVTGSATNGYYYLSGSRVSAADAGRGNITLTNLIDAGHNRFTAPFWGGFDGFDITKPDPLYN